MLLLLLQLKREFDEATAAGDKVKAAQVDEKIKARISVLMHVYHTVAVHFADLHDTPERMLEKECISEIVPWRESRRWLYWRLRRLLLEDAYIKKILRAQDNLSVGQAKQMLRRWLVEDKGATEVRPTVLTHCHRTKALTDLNFPLFRPICGTRTRRWFPGIRSKPMANRLCPEM